MSATKRLSDVPKHRAGWKLCVNGVVMPENTEWEIRSPFGSVESAVVLDSKGVPVFDRPSYREAKNVNLVVWGRDASGIKIAVLRQPRPHSDDPERDPGVENQAVVFGQTPMGFAEKILGESLEDTAVRETAEETGARLVLHIEKPTYPWHNPNPTFVATWSNLLFVEVDLEKIEQLRFTRSEPIFSAEFISPKVLIGRIREGKDEKGAVYRMCTSNSAWLIFFCTHPEFFT